MKRSTFIRNSLLSVGSLASISHRWPNVSDPSQSITEPLKGLIKITNVRTYIHPSALFVKIETDAGISGWGEGDHDHKPIVAKFINQFCSKHLKGQDPFLSEYIWNNIFYLGEDIGSNGLMTGALAGIDNALWDLKGKITQQPVYKLLGGNKIDKIKVYASFGRGEDKKIKSPAACAKIAAGFIEKGFDTVKIRMQLRIQNRNLEDDSTEVYVKSVREAIGDQNTLFVDFNNGYTPGKARGLIQKLYEKYNVALVEEPVSYKDLQGLKQIVANSPIRIGAGEHEFNRFEIRDLILHGNPDVVNLDVIKGGGISEVKKSACLCQAFEKEVMCHNARPTLATAATLHVVASIYNAARIQEYGGERPELNQWEYFEDRFRFENGYLDIPQQPGLGLNVIEKEMNTYLVKD